MIPTAIHSHRDAMTILIAGLSICLTMFFGHFKTWRHRICFEYDGKQAAAVAALRDKFQEEAGQHYRVVQEHIHRTGETVQQFYAEGRQRTLVKALALRLERSNGIIRVYRYLGIVSQAVEFGFLIVSAALVLSMIVLWVPPVRTEIILAGVILVVSALMVGLMFVLLYLEGRFITATSKALRPELD